MLIDNIDEDIAPEFDFFDDDGVIEIEEEIVEEKVEVDTPPVVEEESTEEPLEFEVKKKTEEPVVETEEDDDKGYVYSEEEDSTAVGVYKTLIEKKFIGEQEDFDGSFEKLDEVFEKLPDTIFKETFEQFPEPLQNVLKYAYNKENATWEELREFITQHSPADYLTLDISTVEGQRSFAEKVLTSRGQEAEDATVLIDTWEDTGKLESKVKALHDLEKRKDSQKAEEKIEEEAEARRARKVRLKAFSQSVTTELENTGYDDTVKHNIAETILGGKLNALSKKVSQHPKALIQLTHFLSKFDEKKGEIDVELFKKQVLSAPIEKIKKGIKNNFSARSSSATIKNKKKQNNNQEFELILE